MCQSRVDSNQVVVRVQEAPARNRGALRDSILDRGGVADAPIQTDGRLAVLQKRCDPLHYRQRHALLAQDVQQTLVIDKVKVALDVKSERGGDQLLVARTLHVMSVAREREKFFISRDRKQVTNREPRRSGAGAITHSLMELFT